MQLSVEQQDLFKKSDMHEIFPEYYLIKINNFDDVAKNTLDEWIYFLKNEEIKDDFKARGLKKAKQELDVLKLSDEERLAYSRYQDELHYQASMFESTYIVGMRKGEEKGIKKGITQRNIEIARKLLAAGLLDIQNISEVTGLSLEEIEDLKHD